MIPNNLKNHRLFKECIEALTPNVTILSQEESDFIFNMFEPLVPIYEAGSRIDWDKVKDKTMILSLDLIIPSLGKLLRKPVDTSVYAL